MKNLVNILNRNETLTMIVDHPSPHFDLFVAVSKLTLSAAPELAVLLLQHVPTDGELVVPWNDFRQRRQFLLRRHDQTHLVLIPDVSQSGSIAAVVLAAADGAILETELTRFNDVVRTSRRQIWSGRLLYRWRRTTLLHV